MTDDARVELPAVEEELSENWRERVTRALVSERSPMTAAVQPGPSTPFAAGRRAARGGAARAPSAPESLLFARLLTPTRYSCAGSTP